ncbi:cytochrome P450 7B1 [Varanus komodoensis]|uniref:Cytochrome P450 family 7 subfamily B member 1 n=1 Tax=Varanus komodoensis TaxID=61221 RepID=A0A8D2IQE6_VARKO|nr:cytochrome P450 7B1 [Varanus komodoensis]
MGLIEGLPLHTYGLAVVAALALWAVYVFCGRKRRPGEPPLIKSWIPFLGEALKFRNDSTGLLLSFKQKYGDNFTLYMTGKYITFLMNPLQFGSIIRSNKHLEFEFSDQAGSKAFDFPPTVNEKFPELNEHLHRMYQYLLGKPLDTLSDKMMKTLQDLLKERFSQATDWKMEKLHKFCFTLIFEASFRTLYGSDPDSCNAVDVIGDKFIKFDAKFPLLALKVPIAFLGSTKRIRKELIDFFYPKKMSKCLEVSEVVQNRMDLFEMYKQLGEYDKAAHHFAFMWASVANTIPATFWAMYYLLRHPEALEVVRDEIDHLLQSTGQKMGPGYSVCLTREQLDNLVYLESAVNESLRLCSSSLSVRSIKKDFMLKLEGNLEISLRKGDWIALFPATVHMDPEVYEDPKNYKFDRYVEDGKRRTSFYKQGRKLKYFLMPFGFGSNICPGRFFAVNEIKIFLFFLLSYFDVEIMEDKEVRSDKSRIGLGIKLPDSDVIFRYRVRS